MNRRDCPHKTSGQTLICGGRAHKERLGYDTQKPEALVKHIICASSNESDLVLDCFVGSGTTAAVAEKLNRRWIACDLGRFAIHTTRKRLLNIEGVRPFVVQNLGKYERQLWQTGQFAKDGPETPEQADKRHRAYVNFILALVRGQRRSKGGPGCTVSRAGTWSTSAASRLPSPSATVTGASTPPTWTMHRY